MPLVSDLNAYAADNQAMIERSRVQAGNLAHSLRTPLAVIIDEAERLSANPATRAPGRTLLSQSEVMIQQIEYHLARARSAATARSSIKASVIPEILGPVLNAMRKLHPGKTFDVDTNGKIVPVWRLTRSTFPNCSRSCSTMPGNGRAQASRFQSLQWLGSAQLQSSTTGRACHSNKLRTPMVSAYAMTRHRQALGSGSQLPAILPMPTALNLI
jgi:hypothetical protein